MVLLHLRLIKLDLKTLNKEKLNYLIMQFTVMIINFFSKKTSFARDYGKPQTCVTKGRKIRKLINFFLKIFNICSRKRDFLLLKLYSTSIRRHVETKTLFDWMKILYYIVSHWNKQQKQTLFYYFLEFL